MDEVIDKPFGYYGGKMFWRKREGKNGQKRCEKKSTKTGGRIGGSDDFDGESEPAAL